MDPTPNLGPCCACGQARPDVRNVMMLPRRAPTLGTGWGCLVCGLPNDGAVAVLCDECYGEGRVPQEVCAGLAAESHMRVPIDALLPGGFDHDMEKHATDPSRPRVVALRVDEEELNALVALVKPLAHDPDSLPPIARVALRIVAGAVGEGGACMVCGCTDVTPCPGGCEWVNERCTFCSACLEEI